ncbi:hypothetical protein [Planktotalea sp.]|uniref:hypothetical protein n=1 Tax=Planktotalea sp. TaxID=2029877 RepID=UPI0032982CBC
MDDSDFSSEVVFLNRDEERETLLSSLPPTATQSQLLIVRGPTGVGKSSLTEWVCEQIDSAVTTVVIDPYIRGRDLDPNRAYDGYYLQLCVAGLDEHFSRVPGSVDRFAQFALSRGVKNLKGFDVKKTLKEVTSLTKMVGHAVDASERVTGRGSFSPKSLLTSDSAEAIEVCAEYFSYVVSNLELVLVVREGQHFDTVSLRHILRSMADSSQFFPLIEYTSNDQRFQKRHDVQIKNLADPKIWDIDVLDWPYVAELLQRYGQHDQTLIGEFQAHWDGNLRTIDELKYRVTLGTGTISTKFNAPLPHNAISAIALRLKDMTRAERLLLAILQEHNEPIAREVLLEIWEATDSVLGLSPRLSDVQDNIHSSLLSISDTSVGLNNDDVASAISDLDDASLYAISARDVLLAFYENMINTGAPGSATRAVAMRHTTRFAALKKDPVLLEKTLERLNAEIDAKGDPTTYVDQVIACLRTANDLGSSEREALGSWAAQQAYRSSNFELAVDAIEVAQLAGPIWDSVLAHALIEVHREPEATEIANRMRNELPFDQADLMSDLILGNLDLVHNRLDACQRRLERTIEEAKRRDSVLLGHAYRLLESAVDIEAAIELCQKSTDVYVAAGLSRSEGQSRLTITRHLSRVGLIDGAYDEISKADDLLNDVASSRHFLLNNRAAVELMSAEPNYDSAAGDLKRALFMSRDRFSDLTILQNLAICVWQMNGADAAVEVVNQALRALEELDSTTKLMADSVGGVAIAIFEAAGRHDDALRVASFVIETVGVDIDADPYWVWRYNRSELRPQTHHAYVLDKPYHPSFLSQWQLDWEVLSELFQ